MVRSAYLKAKVNKVPEERQDLLRRFLEDCVSLIGRMQAEAQRAQAAAQAPAPGMGSPEGMVAPTGATPAAMSEQMMAEEAAAPQGAEQAIPM